MHFNKSILFTCNSKCHAYEIENSKYTDFHLISLFSCIFHLKNESILYVDLNFIVYNIITPILIMIMNFFFLKISLHINCKKKLKKKKLLKNNE